MLVNLTCSWVFLSLFFLLNLKINRSRPARESNPGQSVSRAPDIPVIRTKNVICWSLSCLMFVNLTCCWVYFTCSINKDRTRPARESNPGRSVWSASDGQLTRTEFLMFNVTLSRLCVNDVQILTVRSVCVCVNARARMCRGSSRSLLQSVRHAL